MYVNPTHFSECQSYKAVFSFNEAKQLTIEHTYHESIQKLLIRMNIMLDNKDIGGVIAAAGSTIEALAKEVSGNSGSTFHKVRKTFESSSVLTPNMKSICEELYILRNKEPNAGHGDLDPDKATYEEAAYLATLVKSIVEIEYRLKES